MRDLPFLLRLHASAPLSRFKKTTLKPYLPLEVRYIIRPTGEVLLYVSNDPNRQTSYKDISSLGDHRWNRLFLSTDGALAVFHFQCPKCTENFYSYSTVKEIFIRILCRRGLACHYLRLYEARWRPLYERPSQENIAPPKNGTGRCAPRSHLWCFSYYAHLRARVVGV